MKKIRYFFEYLLVSMWLWLTKMLGLEYSIKISKRLFRAVAPCLKATKVAKNNLELTFPKKTPQEIETIVLGVWDNLAQVAAETAIILKMPDEQFKSHVKITGVENLLKNKDNPVLMYTAHLANWELIPRALLLHDFPICAIYRKANNQMVDKLISDLRSNFAVRMIAKGKAGAKQIIAALQNNENVAMLVDQKMNDGIKVPFLGRDAMTAPAIAALALKYKRPIIPMQMIRRKDSFFELVIHPAIDYADMNVLEIMTEINSQIGNWVKAHPEQWFWLHRRWIN